MIKQLWACAMCGMSSNRKGSVARHIRSQHNGKGVLLPYTSYIAGVREGLYIPKPALHYIKSKEPDYEQIAREEICREMSRMVVRQCLEKALKGTDILDAMLRIKLFEISLPNIVKSITSTVKPTDPTTVPGNNQEVIDLDKPL